MAKQDFYTASDNDWTLRWLPDHDDLMLGFDRAHALGQADAAGEIIELLVLSANITGVLSPAVDRMAAARAMAPGSAPLTRARLVGFSSPFIPDGPSRLAMALQRVQAWRGAAESKGLCVALAMLALACEAAGDSTAADAALAECLALEDPVWPARLRRRCGWMALSGLAMQRSEPALLARAESVSRGLAPQLARIGATHELLNVQMHIAQTLRVQKRSLEAVTLLREVAQVHDALGRDIDAAYSHGTHCAALLEVAALAEPGPGSPAEDVLLDQARQAAEWALIKARPYPAQLRHFLEPLAVLACKMGQSAMAATLLAGADAMRRELGARIDLLNARARESVVRHLSAHLSTADREVAQALGSRFRGDDMRQAALAWLQQEAGSG